MWNLVKIGQAISEKMFKDYENLYIYIAEGQGQIIFGDKIWLGFATLIKNCKLQPLVFNTSWETVFSVFSPYKCIETQIWPCRKKSQRSTYSQHLNKFGRSWVPNYIYNKIRPQSLYIF